MDTTTSRRLMGGVRAAKMASGRTQRFSGRVAGRAARRAFSLIEVMIVIAIILAISGLVALAMFNRRDQAEASLGQVELNSLKQALAQFRLDYNRYPTDDEGLEVLWNKEKLDPEADQAAWSEYLTAPMPEDRWGNAWGYRQQSEETEDTSKFDLWSFGPDGEEGTEDDITSWSTAESEGEGASELPPPSGR